MDETNSVIPTQPIMYNGQRVLTTQRIADGYGVDAGNVSKNFNRNKDHYTEGKHYFCLEGETLKMFRGDGQLGNSDGQIDDRQIDPMARKVYLWTKKGAFLHAKSLNTDQAWEVYEHLVDFYFDQQESRALVPVTEEDSRFVAGVTNLPQVYANWKQATSQVENTQKELVALFAALEGMEEVLLDWMEKRMHVGKGGLGYGLPKHHWEGLYRCLLQAKAHLKSQTVYFSR